MIFLWIGLACVNDVERFRRVKFAGPLFQKTTISQCT